MLESLQASLGTSLGIRGGCAYHFICLVGGAVLGMLASALPLMPFELLHLPIPQAVSQWVILTGTVVGFLLGLRHLYKERTESIQPYRTDLAENRVEEIHCTVSDAVQVEPFEDEGIGFFLDVGDSQLLFVQGQELDDLSEEGQFPTREIRLVRSPYSGTILDFEWLGESFEPSRVIEAAEVECVPLDGEIIPGRLDTLEADLRRLAQARAGRA